jgi:hypothetical protein
MEEELEKFSQHAINHYKFTQVGDWKKGNAEIRKINAIYKSIKNQGEFARQKLLELIYSDKPEVACLAATYSMSFNADKCLAVLKSLSERNIQHISSASKQAIQNWKNGEWFID